MGELRRGRIGARREPYVVGGANVPICTLVRRVRVAEMAVVPLGVTLVGVTVQVELEGAPPHAREVTVENPLRGVTEMTVVAAVPWVTVAVVDDSERVKSGVGAVVITTARPGEEAEAENAPVRSA